MLPLNALPLVGSESLKFPNAVVLNVVGRRKTQRVKMHANERKRSQTHKSANERKRAQKGAKGDKRAPKRASAEKLPTTRFETTRFGNSKS